MISIPSLRAPKKQYFRKKETGRFALGRAGRSCKRTAWFLTFCDSQTDFCEAFSERHRRNVDNTFEKNFWEEYLFYGKSLWKESRLTTQKWSGSFTSMGCFNRPLQFTKWIKCSATRKRMLRKYELVQRRLFSFEQRESLSMKRVVKKPKGTTWN